SLFWRHVVAASAKIEQAGNEQYQDKHMSAIFQEGFSFSGFERDHLALNLGTKKFLDISGVSGVDSITDGRGAVFADFDNDGDLDIFLTTVQGQAHFLFRNNVGQENGFLRVHLEGNESGHDAFGSVVRVKSSAGTLTKIKAGGSGFVSQHDPRLLFGLGRDRAAEWVEVTWPAGTTQRFLNVAAGTTLKIVEGKESYDQVAEHRFRLVDPLSKEEELLAKLNFTKGEAFPDLRLRTLTHEATQLRRLVRPGHRYFVNLWATYCIPCKKEMPELQRLYSQLQAANIELLGVSIDIDTVNSVPNFLRQHHISYPIYTTEEASIPKIFSGDEVLIPISFLLDGEGRVLEVFAGWSRDSEAKIKRLIVARAEGE
ncbi:MAG: ASPIC/UnbV domain-containing protein, partial [Acidobacteriota bacterium]